MPPRESKASQRFFFPPRLFFFLISLWQHLYERGSFAGPTMRPWIHIYTVLAGRSGRRRTELRDGPAGGAVKSKNLGLKCWVAAWMDRRRMDGWMGGWWWGRVLQLLPHVIVNVRCPPLQCHKTDLGRALQSGERALSGSMRNKADSIQHLLPSILAQQRPHPPHPTSTRTATWGSGSRLPKSGECAPWGINVYCWFNKGAHFNLCVFTALAWHENSWFFT